MIGMRCTLGEKVIWVYGDSRRTPFFSSEASSITYRNHLGFLAPRPQTLAAVAAAERDMLGTRQVVPS